MSSLIKDIRIYKNINNTLPWKLADGSFNVADVVNIKFTLVKGKEGPFVSLPSDKVGDKYYNKVFMVKDEAKGIDYQTELNNLIIAAYRNLDKKEDKPTKQINPEDVPPEF